VINLCHAGFLLGKLRNIEGFINFSDIDITPSFDSHFSNHLYDSGLIQFKLSTSIIYQTPLADCYD
jgi:hypothetical protein